MKSTVVKNSDRIRTRSAARMGDLAVERLLRCTSAIALLCAVSCQATPEIASVPPTPSCCSEPAELSAGVESVAQLAVTPFRPVPATILSPAILPPVADETRRTDRGPPYTREFHRYRVPDLTLIDEDGRNVSLISELESGPVALNFVFTTCTTICPVMTATFSRLSHELSDEQDLRLVSITLDPEYDSPKILKGFSRRYGAESRWKFLTGDARSLAETYRAFNAVTGSKFNHRPFTLFKVPGESRWLRIEGMASVADLAAEYRDLARKNDSFQAGG